MDLPKDFLDKLRRFPDNVCDEYLLSLDEPVFSGYRVNTLKADIDSVHDIIKGEPAPFCAEGFYTGGNRAGLGRHPLHHAGVFYIQEPSAMSAVTALSPQKGDWVLDLCAAPGGKSTQIAAALGNSGVLLSNEFVSGRAKILLSNIERMGIANAVITSAHPDSLCESVAGLFDKILVDAPCSGEGMFRKEPLAVQNWSQANVETCAARQLAILESAVKALRPGGIICYSTCTFSPEEDEGVVEEFLSLHNDFELVAVTDKFGRGGYPEFGGNDARLSGCRRVFPMDGGEGHFVALFKNSGTAPLREFSLKYDKPPEEFTVFWEETFIEPAPENIRIYNGKVLIVPDFPEISGTRLLRNGLLAGEVVRGRFEPAHALFMTSLYTPRRILNLSPDGSAVEKFLRGEQLDAPEFEKGFAGVRVAGVPCGFGKVSGGCLKNRYPKGLRLPIG